VIDSPYAVPTVPFGNVDLVITIGVDAALTYIVNVLSLNPKLLVALNVADRVVGVLGVPVISPVDELRVNGLIDPLSIDHVIGLVPDAVKVEEYAVLTVPDGKKLVTIIGADPTIGYQLPLPMSTLSVIRLSS
jgi:hypothetical protein